MSRRLSPRSDVLRVDGNPVVHNDLPQPIAGDSLEPDRTEAIEPGINNTRAPRVWTLGYTGQGIVVGGADTGYHWTHGALKCKYRGWDGNAASSL
jgi:serine protease AprX